MQVAMTGRSPFDKLVSFAEWLGFTQKRCSNCAAPYFLGELRGDFASLRLCPECQISITWYDGPRCRLCGVIGPGLNADSLCSECVKEPPPWQGVAYYGIYDAHLRDLILRLKYDAELQLVYPLADFLLQAAMSLPEPDAILAVPQHPAALRRRGFNQAHELARRLARLTGFRLDSGILARTRKSVPQEGLGAEARRQNVIGAFSAFPAASGAVLWLIDDVMTTGSTCAEATRALLGAGAKAVFALCVARTPLP